LHDQAARRGDRAGPGHRRRHRSQPRRPDRRAERRRDGHDGDGPVARQPPGPGGGRSRGGWLMANFSELVVDDVPDMAQTIAHDGAKALAAFTADPTDVVITDLRMKGSDGLDLLAGIKQADPATPVIIMTAFGAVETAVEAMRRGAYHYVTKPFALETLRAL